MTKGEIKERAFRAEVGEMFPDGYREVQPVKVDNRDGRTDKQYSFTMVHFNRMGELTVDIGNVITYYLQNPPTGEGGPDDILVWHYEGKPAVFITQRAVYASEDSPLSESQRQAYFALNYLDGEAMVTGWSE